MTSSESVITPFWATQKYLLLYTAWSEFRQGSPMGPFDGILTTSVSKVTCRCVLSSQANSELPTVFTQ